MSSRVVVIRCTDGRVKTISLGQKLTLGRGSKSDLRILDKKSNSVSRNHALIAWDPGDEAPVVTDQNSSNGTILNGVWIKESVALKNGDKLVLGRAEPMFIEFGSDMDEADSAATVALDGSSAVILKAQADQEVTDRWSRADLEETEIQMGWLRSRGSLVGVLQGLQEKRKTGIVTLGDAEDNRSINVRIGRIVSARDKGVVGQDALDALLDLPSGGTVYRFADQTTVPRGGLNVLPSDLDDD